MRGKQELQKKGKVVSEQICHKNRNQEHLGEGNTLEGGNYISKQHLFLPEDHTYPHEYETTEDRKACPWKIRS